MVNKKAQIGQIWLILLTAVLLFFAGTTVIGPIATLIDGSWADLNCAAAGSISDGNKMMCLMVDLMLPYTILILASIAGSLVINRFIGGDIIQ